MATEGHQCDHAKKQYDRAKKRAESLAVSEESLAVSEQVERVVAVSFSETTISAWI
jgi:hypothetical protein